MTIAEVCSLDEMAFFLFIRKHRSWWHITLIIYACLIALSRETATLCRHDVSSHLINFHAPSDPTQESFIVEACHCRLQLGRRLQSLQFPYIKLFKAQPYDQNPPETQNL